MTRTTRLLATLIFGLLFTGIGGVYLQSSTPVRADDPSLQLAANDTIPTTTSPPTTFQEVTIPTTTAPAPARVTRQAAPVRPTSSKLEPIIEIGVIEIPKIGLRHAIYHGITMRNIDRGPSHWPGTAFPGENGNTVFAGHRVTKTRPFFDIDQLVPGDKVYFTVQDHRSVYVVTGSEVVTPKALWIVNQTPEPTGTLFACHPKGSAKYRYVVHLALSSE